MYMYLSLFPWPYVSGLGFCTTNVNFCTFLSFSLHCHWSCALAQMRVERAIVANVNLEMESR